MFDSEINNLNLDLEYINCSTTALIREYLARKGLRKTLETFDEENQKSENLENITSRTKLIEYLKIQKLYEKNKTLRTPFKTLFELLVSYHTANFKNQDSKQMDKKKESNLSFSSSTKKLSKNDLKIDDAEDGELLNGFDKRISSKEKEEEKFDFNSLTKTKPSSKNNLKQTSSNSSSSSRLKEAEAQANKVSNDYKKPVFFAANNDLNLEDKPSKTKETIQYDDLLIKSNSSSDKSDKQEEKPFNFNNYLSKSNMQKNSSSSSNSNLSSNSSNQSNDFSTKPIDFDTAKELRSLLFGNITQSFSEDWKIQNLSFSDLAKLKFGIVQKKGGPCGVLAAIQSYVLLEIIFGNNDEPPKDTNLIFNPTKKDRSRALAKGLARLIWKCSYNDEAIIVSPSSKAYFAPVGKYRSDGITETLNLLKFNNYQNLENYLIKNVDIFENDGNSSCIIVLYSAILTRTIPKVIKDMDDSSNKLMGMHGYCSMEMVNLLIHGRAVSNVFNDSTFLDNLELRGPNKRNDIGLLSLFEHYKSCEVGSYYKTPKYPIWVVCSESHFSVIFALRKDILNDWKAESKFDLYYYDGLARQDEQIRLTISSKNLQEKTKPSFFDEIAKNKKVDKDKELIPPLELVIRTKWKGAYVNWNSTEPIL